MSSQISVVLVKRLTTGLIGSPESAEMLTPGIFEIPLVCLRLVGVEAGDSVQGGRQEQSDQFRPCQLLQAAARQTSVRDASLSCARQLVLVTSTELISSSPSYRTALSHDISLVMARNKTRSCLINF